MYQKQRRGEDENLFFFFADFARLLQRSHDDEVGEERGYKAYANAKRRAGVGTGMQIVAGGPGCDDGCNHQRAVGQIKDAGDAENQSKARGAERVQRTDRKAVDQDLPEQHCLDHALTHRTLEIRLR